MSGRSAAERERARWEREVRRAKREGRTPPPEPVFDARSPVPEDPGPGFERPAEPPAPAPALDARSPVPEDPGPSFERPAEPPAVAQPPAAEPPAVAAPPAAAPPTAAQPARRTVRLPRAAHVDPGTGEFDTPLGVKRYETQPGAPGLPPNRPVPPRRKRRTGARALALVVLLAIAGIAYGAVRLYQPFHGDPGAPVAVTIPEGAGASDIGEILEQEGVVDSATFFAVRARLDGGAGLRSGPHRLQRGLSYEAALAALRKAPEAAPTIDVTVPEGPSIDENRARVKQAGVEGDYARAARAARREARRLGLPRSARTLEGFLFPATYELRRPASAEDLVAKQLEAFADNTAEIDYARARRANLTRYEVLIIASMVEREALIPKERRIIAGVIYNRLQQGIPLGIDATIRYEADNWSRPLRVSELQKDTPYNTRLNQGLPPTPIGNPGAEAIAAAANPADHDLLFYVVKPCGNGAHAFSETDAEFQRDVAAYNRERDKRGGKDPSRC